MKFYGHDHHFKFYESIGADFSSKMKKIGFLMFSLYASIGSPEGNKETIDLSSCVKHHSE